MSRPRLCGPALSAALDALDELDAMRRAGKDAGREYQAAFARWVDQRSMLTPQDRTKADGYSQQLWAAFTAFLAEEAKRQAPPKRPMRRETTGHRRTPMPTAALPGSEDKVRELANRRRRGTALFAPADVDEDDPRGLRALKRRNGAHKGRKGTGAGLRTAGTKISPDVIPAGVATNLRAARRERGWGQKVLSRKSGFTQGFISMAERGVRRPSIEAVRAPAAALQVTTDRLLGVETAAVG